MGLSSKSWDIVCPRSISCRISAVLVPPPPVCVWVFGLMLAKGSTGIAAGFAFLEEQFQGSEGLWDQTGIQKSSFQSPLASWGKSLKLPKPALPPCLISPSPFPCFAYLDGEISEFRAVCGFP